MSGDVNTLSLRSVQRVDMLVPPVDSATSGESGFWVEIRDGADRTVYRRVLGDALQDSIEVFAENPEETIVRRPSPPGPREFVVIVPDTGEPASAVFFSTPFAEGRSLGPAREMARFELR